MKKRFLMLTAAMCFTFAIPAHAEIEEIYDPSLPTATETAQNTPLFDLTFEDCHVKYTGYSIETTYNGGEALLVYFDFTNLKGTAGDALWSHCVMRAYQNGVEIDNFAVLKNDVDAASNLYKKVQPNVTLNVAETFKLTDKSDVTIEITDMYNSKNVLKSVTIPIK